MVGTSNLGSWNGHWNYIWSQKQCVCIYIYVDSKGWKPGNMRYSNYHDHLCLVGGWPTPWKIWKSDWIIIPTIGENKKCSKPPTRNRPWDDKFLCFFLHIYLVGGAITILKNDGVRQWEGLSHIWNGQIKAHVWNHQPDLFTYLFL